MNAMIFTSPLCTSSLLGLAHGLREWGNDSRLDQGYILDSLHS